MKLEHVPVFVFSLASLVVLCPFFLGLYSLDQAFNAERDKVYSSAEIEIRALVNDLKFRLGTGHTEQKFLERLSSTDLTHSSLEEILYFDEDGMLSFSHSAESHLDYPPSLSEALLRFRSKNAIARILETQQILVHSRIKHSNDGQTDFYMVVNIVNQMEGLWLVVFNLNLFLVLFLIYYFFFTAYLLNRVAPFFQVVSMAEALSKGNANATVNSSVEAKFPWLVTAMKQMALSLKEKDQSRVNTEKELQHSQLALREAHRIGGMGSWSQDFIQQEYFWSDHLFEMIGLAPRTITKEWLRSVIHPDDLNILEKRIAVQGEISEFELRLLGDDGDYRYFITRWESQFDENGRELKRFGTAQNVTERQLESMALLNQERTLAEVEEKSHLGDWEWDIANDQLTWSAETYRIFGYQPGEFKPHHDSFHKVLHPDDRERAKNAMALAFNEDENYKIELRILRPNGQERTILAEATIHRNSLGEPIRLVGTDLDITERKVAESLSYLLTQAIEQAAEAFVITGTDGAFVYVNSAFEGMTGYSEEEALGETMALLASGHHDDDVINPIQMDLSEGNKWRGRIVNKAKDGKLLTHETVVSPVFDVNGSVANYVIVMRDVTEELVVQAQLYQAQKMESIGRLAGGVAHDFNNMLTVILGRSELIKNKIKNDSLLSKEIDEIIKAARNSAVITRQLLAFARKDAIKPKYINLNELIEPTINMLERLIGDDILLNWNPGIFEGSVHIDPVQINQILTNLCVNSRDAIDNTGSITIETGKVRINSVKNNSNIMPMTSHFLVLSVTDTGRGMSEDVIENIFEPFFTTKDSGEGTGLGLSMVYGMVNQNKGQIRVSSKLKKGTVIQIYLPCYEGKEMASETRETHQAESAGGETILIIEDNIAVQELAIDMLSNLEYHVLSALNPEAGLKLFEDHKNEIDLVITDVVMPEMNGRELIDKMLRLRPELKYLFMSGYTQEVINQRGILEEGIHFIQKPFRYADFANKIRVALKK